MPYDLQISTGTMHLVLKFMRRERVWRLSVRVEATGPPCHCIVTKAPHHLSLYWEGTGASPIMTSQRAGVWPPVSLHSYAVPSPWIFPSKRCPRSQAARALCHSPLLTGICFIFHFGDRIQALNSFIISGRENSPETRQLAHIFATVTSQRFWTGTLLKQRPGVCD